MPKIIAALSAKKVESLLKKPGVHAVSPGLYLKVVSPTAASWIVRKMVNGVQSKRGLGAYKDVTLADARKLADGAAPIRQPTGTPTFGQVVADYLASHEAGWSNAKHAQQWRATLNVKALNNLLINEITVAHVLAVLRPMWTTKTETAIRTRGRIEKVLDYAKVLGHRDGENPARWGGNLAVLLPAPDKVRTVEHMPAAPWEQVPSIYATLTNAEGVAATMLRLQVLCAVRPGEARLMRWEHIDGDTWTIPATMTKQKREHRVPLSAAALELLQTIERRGEHVFVNPMGDVFSDMAATELLRRLKMKGVTAHGFRSSFRDWCSDAAGAAFEIAEQCLGHAIGDKVSRSYARSDGFERRRALMSQWATFVTNPEPVDNVVTLRASA